MLSRHGTVVLSLWCYNLHMEIALTIAGSDPSGGAGLQADLKVFKELGVHGLSVPTALTSQNTMSVEGFLPVDPSFIEQQLRALLADMVPGGLKTGMLAAIDAVKAIAPVIRDFALKNLVVDPVSVSSSGALLMEEGGLDALRDELFPLAAVITPNIYEAAVLSGLNVETPEDMEAAARALKETGPGVVIITGGHLKEEAVDVFFDGKEMVRITGEMMQGEYHGTGCVFSAAITAFLTKGIAPLKSTQMAKEFVSKKIKSAFHPGKGMGILI